MMARSAPQTVAEAPARRPGRRGKRVMARALGCAVAVLGLVACGRGTKEDIVSKARDISKRAELERVLGQPDEITKLGPVETWRYRASNGEVIFVIVGDDVTLQAAGGRDKAK
jgi:hypothetical protein